MGLLDVTYAKPARTTKICFATSIVSIRYYYHAPGLAPLVAKRIYPVPMVSVLWPSGRANAEQPDYLMAIRLLGLLKVA